MSNILDLSNLKTLFAGHEDELASVIELFITSATKSAATLQESVSSGDNESWRDAAHKLRGLALNIGAPALAELSDNAENEFEAPEEEKTKMAAEIANILDQTVNALKEE